MNDDSSEIPDEIKALVGRVAAELLAAGGLLTTRQIIAALHRLSLSCADRQTGDNCNKAILILSRKLH